jgi:DNA-binding MarR family transcriptional regulator
MPNSPPAERLRCALSVLAPHLQPTPLPDEIPPGLSLGTARVLMELTGIAAEPAVGDLAARLRLPLPRISKLLGELEDRGLIERTRHAQDRRRVEVRLLPAGQRAAAGFRKPHGQRLEQLIEVLGPRDTEQLLRIFERAAARLSSQNPDSRPRSNQEATP